MGGSDNYLNAMASKIELYRNLAQIQQFKEREQHQEAIIKQIDDHNRELFELDQQKAQCLHEVDVQVQLLIEKNQEQAKIIEQLKEVNHQLLEKNRLQALEVQRSNEVLQQLNQVNEDLLKLITPQISLDETETLSSPSQAQGFFAQRLKKEELSIATAANKLR